jgi:hypothetical protein
MPKWELGLLIFQVGLVPMSIGRTDANGCRGGKESLDHLKAASGHHPDTMKSALGTVLAF